MTDHRFRSKYATEYSFAIQMLILSGHLYLERFELGFGVNILVEEGHRNPGQVQQVLRDLKTAPKGGGLERLNIISVGLCAAGRATAQSQTGTQ